MRIVLTLGGNALLPRGATPDTAIQVAKVRLAVAALRPLAEQHELVITHGNGPQIGLLAAAVGNGSAGSDRSDAVYPLDTLVAQTQGMIGFWLTQALSDALPGRRVAGLVTRTRVDARDLATPEPSVFVGAALSAEEARRLGAERGWTVAHDGELWRRMVPSLEPLEILEADVVSLLLDQGAVVVCAGGGGVPVSPWEDGSHEGVEAVVDRDLASAVLAEQLEADLLVTLTDVPGVVADLGGPGARLLEKATPAELRALALSDRSMGPKAEACARFVERTDRRAAIGALGQAADVAAGRVGTQVVPARSGLSAP